MPDILGNWDRRADDPDYNSATEKIEPGYQKRMQKLVKEEEKEESNQSRRLTYYFKTLGITKHELKEAGFSLSNGCGNDKFYTGKIQGRCGGLNEARLRINKKTKETFIEIVYKSEYNVNQAEEYHESWISNLGDLMRIESAIKLRDFLDKKKIPYREEVPRQKVKIELNKLNKRISGLIKKISNF